MNITRSSLLNSGVYCTSVVWQLSLSNIARRVNSLRHRMLLLPLAFLLWQLPSQAEEPSWEAFVESRIAEIQHIDSDIAMKIGHFAERGFHEVQSSALLQDRLAGAGFEIETGVAGMPTAFVASYGSGEPVIGFLAEFDALPGLSQAAVPHRQLVPGQNAGHGCGHNLLGTGSVLAAIATADWLRAAGHAGTVRVYGTPAEEGGGGKVYMVREGLFEDVTAVMNWHPDSFNASMTIPNLAAMTGIFQFRGQAAHAAVAPELGRSALDGVEAMNMMVNMMREHIGEKTRVHYAITSTNRASNVVPDFAEVKYTSRDPNPKEMKAVWERIKKAAEGAARGTETTVDYEIVAGYYGYLPNDELAAISYKHLERLSGISYTPEELDFARTMAETLPDRPDVASDVAASAAAIRPFAPGSTDVWSASSDVGDVSWTVPTNWVRTAAWVPGTKAHTWQSAAASNTTIGVKAMHLAAKVLALTAVELFQSPASVDRIQAEFERRTGKDFAYEPFIGDRQPPLDTTVESSSRN